MVRQKMTPEEFIAQTIPTQEWHFLDMSTDNACFYRSVAHYIYFACPGETISRLKNLRSWGDTKSIEAVLSASETKPNLLDDLARHVQRVLVYFVELNPDKVIDDTELSIRQYIPVVHERTWEEYVMTYKQFAADDLECDDRWGSPFELAVLSYIFRIPILLFSPQVYQNGTTITGRIINNQPVKNVRMNLFQTFGKHNLPTLPMFVIWKRYKQNGHYLTCFPKSMSTLMPHLYQTYPSLLPSNLKP